MEPLAGVADQFGQALFNIEVHVFEVELPVEPASLDLAADLAHAFDDRGMIGRTDDALVRQHGGVGQRAVDVVGRQAFVEKHRSGVALDQLRDRFGKTRRPGFAFFGKLCCHLQAPVSP